MSPQMTLFVLRLLSATLLLAFLGLLVWFVRSELRRGGGASKGRRAGQTHGAIVLVSATGAEAGRFELRPVTSIGRLPSNTVVIEERYVSAEHALLSYRDAHWWLEDLGSRNGTLLNGLSVTKPIVAQDGDMIAIGDTSLRLELPDV
ncbi:MAG: FHA domain-containing protein [Anaerolineae bacterium]|nr:FHA domain-containing protein [Anaerolineae bacterium]